MSHEVYPLTLTLQAYTVAELIQKLQLQITSLQSLEPAPTQYRAADAPVGFTPETTVTFVDEPLEKPKRAKKEKVEAKPSKPNGGKPVEHPAPPAGPSIAELREQTVSFMSAIYDRGSDAAMDAVEGALQAEKAESSTDIKDDVFPAFAATIEQIYTQHMG